MESKEDKVTNELTVYACGYCGKLWKEKSDADFCHSDRTCTECGVVIGKKNYYTKCESCMIKSKVAAEKVLFDNARKMTVKEYAEEFGENPIFFNDEYYYDVEDIFDSIDEEDNKPNYVWGTKATTITLDAENIISNFEENCELEDYSMDYDAQKEIFEFCKQWNEKHAQTVYYQDKKVAIILDKEIE